MKKKLMIAGLAVIVLALILFLPIPQGICEDGGTRVYAALTYKIVAWNKIMDEVDENGETVHNFYRQTTAFWYPDNQKRIDELWEIEKANNLQVTKPTTIVTLNEAKTLTQEQLAQALKGQSVDSLYDVWGDCDYTLSGMYGAVWNVDGQYEIVIYDDGNGKVTDAYRHVYTDGPVQLHPLYKKYPEYFDLDDMKGIEIYLWKVGDAYYCGALSGTNRLKTYAEIQALMGNGATIEEMKTILLLCEVQRDRVSVISVEHLFSSFWPGTGSHWNMDVEILFWGK